MKNKKVLVIGGAGFIGSHVVDALVKGGAIVTVIDNLCMGNLTNLLQSKINDFGGFDAKNYELLQDFLIGTNFDLVYNLAVLSLPHSLLHPKENFNNNVGITQNLCSLLKKKVFKRLIQFSSSEVYGTAQYIPMDESHPFGALTPYAASKAACDLLCLSYYKTFGCNISILRPFNNYGPRQNKNLYAGIIPLTIKTILHNEIPFITGTGEQTRDYIYVKDTARAAVMLGKRNDLVGNIFNVGSGQSTTVNLLVKEIMLLMKENFNNITYKPERQGDVYQHLADTKYTRDTLGFQSKVSLLGGLKETIRFYAREGIK